MAGVVAVAAVAPVAAPYKPVFNARGRYIILLDSWRGHKETLARGRGWAGVWVGKERRLGSRVERATGLIERRQELLQRQEGIRK